MIIIDIQTNKVRAKMGNRYSTPRYDNLRAVIVKKRTEGHTWEEIIEGKFGLFNSIDEFLKNYNSIGLEAPFDDIEWRDLVLLQKEAEQDSLEITDITKASMIVGDNQENDIIIPKNRKSSWVLYKEHLKKANGFDDKAISSIEISCERILKQISNDTRNSLPTKGLVIGNVQSGKTANMAGLMAMASDYGYNMFIVLSGTIDNLRVQTQKRILNDLNHPGNKKWQELGHLSKHSEDRDKSSNLHFSESEMAYFTVVLKNKKRLENLLEWLHLDAHQKENMKILIIDDESDQAGVNTADVNTDERKTIARLINNLVHNKNKNDKEAKGVFHAMNYIGYTATPYANVLNEIGDHTLYPKNFIYTLPQSNLYFGPQQIFGVDESLTEEVGLEGLDIIRKLEDINSREIDELSQVHKGESRDIPTGLEQAILWFILSGAALRTEGHKKPISMLVHSSFKVDHHNQIEKAIEKWFLKNRDNIISKAHILWEQETNRFTLDNFTSTYPTYGVDASDLRDYPLFEELLPELNFIVKEGMGRIQIDENEANDLSYIEGIHLCVDNSKSQFTADEDDYMRLEYPSKKHMLEKAPMFIVIGGNTLARGLTLEGLLCSYFLRTTNQGDTLMQMGRWFGYRRGYELFPRIFMSINAVEKFKFLSELDLELRNEIYNMEVLGQLPEEVGIRIKSSPSLSFMRITSKNKMQRAVEDEVDFTGVMNQTVLFDNDIETIKSNLEITVNFIRSLGKPTPTEMFMFNHSNLVWEDIDFELISTNFFDNFLFSNRSRVFNRINVLQDWIKINTEDRNLGSWNVVFAGLSNDNSSKLDFGNGLSVAKVSRTRKKSNENESDFIDIGVLRGPKDLISDIRIDQYNQLDDELIKKEMNKNPKITHRNYFGLNKTPQLTFYCIDQYSKVKSNPLRSDLDAKGDLIGVVVTIPGGERNQNYIKSIRIDLSKINNKGTIDDVD